MRSTPTPSTRMVALQVEALKVGEDSAYGKIVRLIREAESQRVPARRIADRFVKWYTPAALIIAGAVWLGTGDVYRAITILVVACPCALVLATPSAVLATLACAARRGILIKGGKYLEACSDIKIVALDKTGTLTAASPVVKRVISLNRHDEAYILALAAKAEAGSEHPLARAIFDAAHAQGLDSCFSGQMQSYRGLGVEARDENQHITVGSRRFIERIGLSISQEAKNAEATTSAAGETPLFVSFGNEVIGLISIEDRVRPESAEVIESLQEMAIDRVVMLTGDSSAVAHAVARRCGIPSDAVER